MSLNEIQREVMAAYADRIASATGVPVRNLRWKVGKSRLYGHGEEGDYELEAKGMPHTFIPSRAYRRIAKFSLGQFPGCCGICIAWHGSVNEEIQLQGLGNVLTKMMKELAHLAGYTYLMATDQIANRASMQVFRKNKFKQIHLFRNTRSNNNLHISITPTGRTRA